MNHPALRVVYDTGNPASHGQPDTWAWYQAALPWISYVHVKAHTGRLCQADRGHHVWPDEPTSASHVEETLGDLLSRGYTGLFSIEPHLGIPQIASLERVAAYIEYGRRLESILSRITQV